MTWLELIFTFFLVWWIAIFAVLPAGIQTQDTPEMGHDPGAPKSADIKRKFIRTTIIASCITLIIYAIDFFDLFSFQKAFAQQVPSAREQILGGSIGDVPTGGERREMILQNTTSPVTETAPDTAGQSSVGGGANGAATGTSARETILSNGTVNHEFCQYATVHVGSMSGADYVAGEDATGTPVVPADTSTQPIVNTDRLSFDVTIDLARYAGLPVDGTMETQASVAKVDYADGIFYFNGQPVSDVQRERMVLLCSNPDMMNAIANGHSQQGGE